MKKFYLISAIIAMACILFMACQYTNSENGGDIYLSIHEITAPANGASQIVGIDTNGEWIAKNSTSWVALSRSKGSVDDKSCTITISPNTESSKRTAEVIFISVDSSASEKVTIIQEAGSSSPGNTDDNPNDEPNDEPTDEPSDEPTDEPSDEPTDEPTDEPNDEPTDEPTDEPSGDGSISVTQAISEPQGTNIKLQESTVVATSTKSYLLTDGKNHILAYKNSDPNLEIGDKVTVEGTISEYGGLVQLSNPVSTKTGFDDDFRHPSVVELSGADANAFLNNPYIKFVKLRGKLNKSSNYYNITLSDTSSAMASIAYPSSEMCPESYNGKEVEVYGYTIYTTKGQYVYVIATSVKVINSNPDDGGGSGDDNNDDNDNTGNDSDSTGNENQSPEDAVFYRDWAELPLCDDRGSNFQYVSHGGYTIGGKSNQRNFTMCFDKANKAAIWVAYPLHECHTGNSGRTDAWDYDPKIPTQYQPYLNKSYDGSYDRGHQLPSGSRTCSKTVNNATFYYSNMTPQASNFNQKGWATLENNVRNDICSDTLYVVTGALFKGNNDSSIKSYTYDANGDKCPIPSHYFKVLLRTKNGNTKKAIKEITKASDLQSIAILLKHTSYLDEKNPLPSSAVISVKELEEFSGITFFPIIDDSIEAEVKKQNNRSDWSF